MISIFLLCMLRQKQAAVLYIWCLIFGGCQYWFLLLSGVLYLSRSIFLRVLPAFAVFCCFEVFLSWQVGCFCACFVLRACKQILGACFAVYLFYITECCYPLYLLTQRRCYFCPFGKVYLYFPGEQEFDQGLKKGRLSVLIDAEYKWGAAAYVVMIVIQVVWV